MLSELQWPTLHNRKLISGLTLLYKGLHNLITLDIPSYITTTTTTTSYITRFQHSFHFKLPTARTNHYHNSYFLKTFRDWNSLPISEIEANTLNCFYNQLCTLYIVIISNCNLFMHYRTCDLHPRQTSCAACLVIN